jgi:uncharacterized membrane protein YhhN
MISLLVGSIAASALANIAADARGRARLVYVFKPLTTGLILLLALTVPAPLSAFYRAAITAGLLFSLAGDVFLMLPRDRFVAGLVSFLVAHLFYSAAFASRASTLPLVPAFLLGAFGAVLLWCLWPRLGRLRVPVTVYSLVLLAMAWLAVAQWVSGDGMRGGLAAAGGLLFVASDSMLALERFGAKHRYGQAAVLATYFAAQTLIALSVSVR